MAVPSSRLPAPICPGSRASPQAPWVLLRRDGDRAAHPDTARAAVHVAVVGESTWRIEGVREPLASAEDAAVEGAIVGGDRVRVGARAAPDDHCADRDADGPGREGVVGD